MKHLAVSWIITWLNDNQGVLTLGIFVITGMAAWGTGIIDALRRRPKFKVRHIDGPTLCVTTHLPGDLNGWPTNRTAIAIYLSISNVGSAPSAIQEVWIGYHWDIGPFSIKWIRYRFGWFWIKYSSVIADDFQVNIGGGKMKVYPFLFQRSAISGDSSKTYLEVGEATNGVVYFEQPDAWGACYPRKNSGFSRMKIKVFDVFGASHCCIVDVPVVDLEEARKYNPQFGSTLDTLRSKDAAGDTDAATSPAPAC